ncbi:Os02g0546500 [Oryza sativa Japonica Group]|uniref:Os02g0546500 protein n=1 Tax=Oryza sativa subsp. japonica TaxID=39947 RepID=Q0E0J4_ORYSJ|nr:Os02g0546500 [Oryza sativa Japonica Group]|eukprot:NP_001047080.2 Os02g0546500 [Oryza sativa Japonica Group]
MAETGPAAIVAALTRAIADDGRGGGATLGGGAPLCPRRRWSCRRVMPEEELVGVVSAARVPPFPLPRCSRLANGCSRTYVASCCVVYRCFTCTVRGSHARRSKRGISGAAVAVRDAPGRARLTPLLRGSHGCNGSTEQRMGGILGWE